MALEYVPLQSSINPSFWHKLTEIKLEVDKLEETNRRIWGYFSNITTGQNTTSLLEVDSTSFNKMYSNQKIYLPFRGVILNKNTIELFKECNKTEIINNIGSQLWNDIKSGEVLKEPSKLNVFFVLSFADLKKYHYYYWFGFPVPHNLNINLNSVKKISNIFTQNEITELLNNYQSLNSENKTYFVIKKSGDSLEVSTLSEVLKSVDLDNHEGFYFAFSDTSITSDYPGSNLRNYLILIMFYCKFLRDKQLNIVSFRLSRNGSNLTCQDSLIFNLTLPSESVESILSDGNNWVGWERNERGKLGPRFSNMKSTLDPKVLAETSVDLNLKLMKWRLLPTIDLDKIKNAHCLLLGSGTLGCSVARILLGWGVRNVTFVDNSTVSYSNPVRQSLFTYEDSIKGNPKSEAAASNLKLIFPGVNSKGVQMSIPMPGHPVGQSLLDKTKENVDNLIKLVQESDVIFLLMDSRESRWLPTLLGSYYNKIVINAALGFDTYLVMRHGVRQTELKRLQNEKQPEGFKVIQGEHLGCYFCNDITAPGNSLKDRTLDQQCTVTRPGVSAIAGALAVELAVSILQHPLGNCAPAFYKTNQATDLDTENLDQCLLGILPHSVRGFLSTYSQVLLATEKYKQCIACSDIVLDQYKEKGLEFLLEVFNSSKYLEELTGLDKIYKDAEEADIWEGSDEEEWC